MLAGRPLSPQCWNVATTRGAQQGAHQPFLLLPGVPSVAKTIRGVPSPSCFFQAHPGWLHRVSCFYQPAQRNKRPSQKAKHVTKQNRQHPPNHGLPIDKHELSLHCSALVLHHGPTISIWYFLSFLPTQGCNLTPPTHPNCDQTGMQHVKHKCTKDLKGVLSMGRNDHLHRNLDP